MFHFQGPFTFLETREKVNISWNLSNGTVAYRQIKKWNFIPELTNGSLDDVVVHLNVPLVASGNDIKRKGGDQLSYGAVNSIVEEISDILFPSHTVRQLLFDGYHDEYSYVGKQLGVETPFDKFGWFYEKNNTASDGLYRIFSGEAQTVHKFGLLDTWNYKNILDVWNNSECNRIDRSTTGDFSPPFTIPKPKIFHLFVADFCRSFPLTLMKEVYSHGLKLDRYWISDKAFDYSLKENVCYCNNEKLA
ncbi:Protein croquemort-like protein [Leptotrombidium deliense]|uniref:Scavenger receptor class B member 1 n=1 Tax=Leptotrombidium deliense TaxID=299467 RepID=A0A443SMH9_9ACAR|nr:Protein croquemort-like protein [Leptotrombidium deliense]